MPAGYKKARTEARAWLSMPPATRRGSKSASQRVSKPASQQASGLAESAKLVGRMGLILVELGAELPIKIDKNRKKSM
jgi:hypothetical protein